MKFAYRYLCSMINWLKSGFAPGACLSGLALGLMLSVGRGDDTASAATPAAADRQHGAAVPGGLPLGPERLRQGLLQSL